MTTFIVFNTINQYKKFTLLEFDLIKRDLTNALNIQKVSLDFANLLRQKNGNKAQ